MNNLVQFLHVCPKYITFRFQNLGNDRENKNRRIYTTFAFNNEKNYRYILLILKFFHFRNHK